MKLEELRSRVEAGEIDTVLIALCDMQGRLQGKRLTARHFLEEVVDHGAEGCNYLLAVDVDMNTVDGYAMSSWERGYGDFVAAPDLATLRPVPWQEGTAMVLCDLAWEDGSDVVASPRQILRRQLARLAERGWSANAGTELEFMVFRETYESAWHKAYRNLEPANLYNVDYSMLGTARDRAADPAHPQRHGGRRDGGRELQGRVQLRPARDQLPLRRGAAHRRRPRHLQERRQGDRRPGGDGDQLHGQVRRARGQLVPHPLLAGRRRRAQRVCRRPPAVRVLPGRAARLPARADPAAGAQHQLLQALRGGLVRPHHGRLGPGQPHLRAARRRPRAGAALRAARRRV